MPVTGQDVVAKNIIAFGRGFTKHVNKTMEKVTVLLDAQVTKNMSLTDHSPADLAKLKHPYAARYGAKGLNLHSPYFQVHRQSGKLIESKNARTVVISPDTTSGVLKASSIVSLDPFEVPYAYAIVYGTSRMIPRPVLTGSRDEIATQAKNIITSNLKNLNLAFREGGGK